MSEPQNDGIPADDCYVCRDGTKLVFVRESPSAERFRCPKCGVEGVDQAVTAENHDRILSEFSEAVSTKPPRGGVVQ
jgi:hypothetical protein